MKKAILISLLCLFSIPRSFAMEEEQEIIELIEETESERNDAVANVAWYKEIFNYVRKNKAKTAGVSALVLATAGGFVSDFGSMLTAPRESISLIALPAANNTTPSDFDDCYYRVAHNTCDVRLGEFTMKNPEECEEYLAADDKYFLQICFDRPEHPWQLFGFASFYSRFAMIGIPIFMLKGKRIWDLAH